MAVAVAVVLEVNIGLATKYPQRPDHTGLPSTYYFFYVCVGNPAGGSRRPGRHQHHPQLFRGTAKRAIHALHGPPSAVPGYRHTIPGGDELVPG